MNVGLTPALLPGSATRKTHICTSWADVSRHPRSGSVHTRQSFIACALESESRSSPGKILLECAKGRPVPRPPVWLMRQAGRYMADFRKFSDKYPFRMRSETTEIAVELSLQPWRAFETDGVIMFSDILTPLPAIGIDFDIVKGKGPTFPSPLRSQQDVDLVLEPHNFDPVGKLPFVRETLSALRSEIGEKSTLLGFVGCPWTLAAYAVEGCSRKDLRETKRIMFSEPQILHSLLGKITEMVASYAIYQIESGAEVIQLFDSWAHHLSPSQYRRFSLPYAKRAVEIIKGAHPNTPIIFFANGGSGKLEMIQQSINDLDVMGIDWSIDLRSARDSLGCELGLQGNIDPSVLFGSDSFIISAVQENCREARPGNHILNLGHGVMQGTPERSVGLFCDAARSVVYADQ
uniref:Uroporphyrinogen decarboxylase n=1 Tax=Timspurckia oligopyrenoides TaxID=708627 RepID=A0A7S1EQE7_9RHOD